MADETLGWEPEQIPDAGALYMRVHKMWVKNGELMPGVFQDRGRGMSTDWNKYSTPEATRGRAKAPRDNGVIELNAGSVRAIDALVVEHEPDIPRMNRAHTEVLGVKDTEVRLRLRRVASWLIRLTE